MTVNELFEILKHEIAMGRGNFKVVMWDTYRVDATDTLRDGNAQEFYICSEN